MRGGALVPSLGHVTSAAVAPVGRSVTDEAISAIQQLIASGRLAPGDRLPPEKELAVQLGLSRSSLREAVRALSLLRVLDVRHGDGTFVSSLRPELLVGVLESALDLLQGSTLLDVFALRRILEPAATALAAVHISERELLEVEACLREMDELHDPQEFLLKDLEFHDRLVRASGNETLAALARSFSLQTVRVRVWRLAAVEGVGDWTRVQHEAIHRAVAARDPELARAAATVHVAEAEVWLRRHLALDPAHQMSDDSLT